MKKLTLFLVIASLGACNWNGNGNYAQEISEIDKMLVQLDSMRSLYQLVDQVKVSRELRQIDSLHEILTGPGADLEDRNYVFGVVEGIEYVKEPYEKFYRDGSQIEEDLEYCESQLKALRLDLENEQLDSLKAREYFFAETKAFNDVVLLHYKRVRPMDKAMAIWDTAAARYLQIASKIDSLAQEQ